MTSDQCVTKVTSDFTDSATHRSNEGQQQITNHCSALGTEVTPKHIHDDFSSHSKVMDTLTFIARCQRGATDRRHKTTRNGISSTQCSLPWRCVFPRAHEMGTSRKKEYYSHALTNDRCVISFFQGRLCKKVAAKNEQMLALMVNGCTHVAE